MDQNLKQPSLKWNFILNTFLQVLNVIAPLLTAPYVSRVLGVNQIGIYSYSYSINYYFVMLVGLGTATYGIIEISKVRDSKEERSRAFWGIELITIMTSVICILVWICTSLVYKEYTKIMLVMTMYLLAAVFDISWFFLGIEKVKYTVFINSIFKIIGVVLIFIFIKKTDDLIKYTAILSGSLMLGNLSMWIFLPRFVSNSTVTVQNILYHIKGTVLYFIPTIASSVYMVLDKTLIGAITHNAAENGYYEQATKIINLVKTVTFTSLNTLLGSRMAYLFAHNEKKEIVHKRDFALNYVLLVGIGACFGLIGISKNFVPIFFGGEYGNVIIFLILMTPLIPVMGISNLIGNLYYNPSGQRKKSTILLVIGCCVNIVLNAVFIPIFNGCGAIIASIIAEVLISIMYVHCSKGFVTFAQLMKFSWKKILSGVIMMIVVIAVDRFCGDGIITLMLQLTFGVLTYLVMLIVLRDAFVNQCKQTVLKRLGKLQ